MWSHHNFLFLSPSHSCVFVNNFDSLNLTCHCHFLDRPRRLERVENHSFQVWLASGSRGIFATEAMTETLKLRGTLCGHNGWVTQIATNPKYPDMILSSSRGKVISYFHKLIHVHLLFYYFKIIFNTFNCLYIIYILDSRSYF